MVEVKHFKVKASKYGERPSTTRSLLLVEPFGTVYCALVKLETYLIKVPFYAALYAIPWMRPVSSWSWGRSLLINYIRQSGRVMKAGRFDRIDTTGEQLATFKPTSSGTPVWIPALETKLTGDLGELMAQTGDESVRTSAWWYGKDHSKQPDGKGKIVLWFHGGGYCFASATPNSLTIKPMLSMLATNAKLGADLDDVPLKGLALEYRLSNIASLPGIIADAVAAWRYLIQDCGYSPSDIIVGGDSAGSNLTLALTRYLISEKPYGGGLPKGLTLYSPWVDMSLSYIYAGAGKSYERYDYLNTAGLENAVGEVLRGGVDSLNLYASSVSLARPVTGKEFEGFPPAIMHGGELEIFHDEHLALAKHYSDAGSPLEVHFDKDVCHDVYVMPFTFDEVHKAAAERTFTWLRKLWT